MFVGICLGLGLIELLVDVSEGDFEVDIDEDLLLIDLVAEGEDFSSVFCCLFAEMIGSSRDDRFLLLLMLLLVC